MRNIHPFLALSPQNFNAKTSLVIGLPMTAATYNAYNPNKTTLQYSPYPYINAHPIKHHITAPFER
jgi:mRNA interferase MazF